MTKQNPAEYRPLSPAVPHYPNDEVTLVDIAVILYRRKAVVLATMILAVVAALTTGFLKGTEYSYSTAITVGSMGQGRLIESLGAVESRLKKAYIPEVLMGVADAHGIDYEDLDYEVNVIVPKDGDYVVLSSKVNESDAEEIKKILNQLVQMVIDEQAKQLETKRGLLREQISDLEKERATFLSTIGSDTTADPGPLMELGRELVNLKAGLRLFTEPTSQFSPTRSIKPVGLSMAVITGLGAVLGLILGMFAAFLAEFIVRTREKMKE